MAKTSKPRSGSMQYWPRKRASSEMPRIRSWAKLSEAKLLGIIAYKVGMKGVFVSKGKSKIFTPSTILECPPMRLLSLRLYDITENGAQIVKEVFFDTTKNFAKYYPNLSSKKYDEKELEDLKSKITETSFLRAVVYSQPNLTGIGRKKPHISEFAISGSLDDQLKYIILLINKDIKATDVFPKAPVVIDVHGVTKGKGFQGPVKRFGVTIRAHKSEKTKRGPGSLGAWNAQGHISYRVAHAGQMGYHLRTEYNRQVIEISSDLKDINPKSGWSHYGNVKSDYFIIKGSIMGARKRAVVLTYPIRAKIKE
ncbi:MAG: 50S ribosomal protein L3 [Nitrospiraceae bacterium]|nr:50S ribosomal protein L3 [Nitrospiraceae bacterium]